MTEPVVQESGCPIDVMPVAFPDSTLRRSYVIDLAHLTPEQKRALELGRSSSRRTLLIWVLWNAGASVREIAEEFDSTVNAVGVTICRMRRRGWPMPYRPGYPRPQP